MREIITMFTCDVCEKTGLEANAVKHVSCPIIFHTEQTEGKPADPYISYETLDLCEDCFRRICVLHARGAQGYNTYFFEDDSGREK